MVRDFIKEIKDGAEKLIDSDDPELEKDEMEQEENEDKTFCLLCGKHAKNEEIVDIQIGPVFLNACKKCNRVMHNLNVILDRARKKVADTMAKELKAKQESSGLIVPKGLTFGRRN